MIGPVEEIVKECLLSRDQGIKLIDENNSDLLCNSIRLFLNIAVFARLDRLGHMLQSDLGFIILLEKLIQEHR